MAESSYEEQRDAYIKINERIKSANLAATYILAEAGFQVKQDMLEKLVQKEIDRLLNKKNPVPEEKIELEKVLANMTVKRDEILNECEQAWRRVNRQGFRPQDKDDPACHFALQAGLAPMADLKNQLQRLEDHLTDATPIMALCAKDKGRFLEVFERLYTDRASVIPPF